MNDPIDLTRNRAPLDAAGSRTITVQLSPSAVAALDRLVASGYATTPAWAISSALIDVGRVLL